MRPALPMRYFGAGRFLSRRGGASMGAYSGGGAPIGAKSGTFAIAARPVTEFGSADIDRFKVE